jgi:FMN phosphatase YigB (HAD superfamily)
MPSIALDWGGVLVTDGSQQAWSVLERELGIPAEESAAVWYEELQEPADRGEIPDAEIWSALARCRPGVREAEIRAVFLAQYVEIPHGVRILRAAKAASWEVVLATNNVSAWFGWWKERFEWLELVDTVCCSSDIGARKPEAAYYVRLRSMLADPEAYFVDDKPENVAAARQSGFRAILTDSKGLWSPPAALHACKQ